MSVQMELNKIIISEMQDQQIIVLKEVDGERKFPIVIGIRRGLRDRPAAQGHPHPRPLTHDLLASVIEQLGGTIERIEINNLQDHTFFARIHIRQDGHDRRRSTAGRATRSRWAWRRRCRSSSPSTCSTRSASRPADLNFTPRQLAESET